MCSPNIPEIPPPVPPPPSLYDEQVKAEAKTATARRAQMLKGYASTIKTGPGGLLGSATTAANKRLLGQ